MSSIPNLDVVDNDQSFNDLLAFEFDFEMDQHPPPPFSAIEPVVKSKQTDSTENK
jgi:hypothetical protein